MKKDVNSKDSIINRKNTRIHELTEEKVALQQQVRIQCNAMWRHFVLFFFCC
jgi:hypothetical protein